MKIFKLLCLPLVLFTLTACSPNKENPKVSSTQTKQSEKSILAIDKTEETVKKERINIDFIYGEWQSVNKEEDCYMVIDKMNDVTLRYSDNLERKDRQELKIAEVSKDSVTALTKDEKIKYNFNLSEEGVLSFSSGVNSAYYTNKGEDIPAGATEAKKYIMLLKCGTEDVSTGFSDTLVEIPNEQENKDLPIVGNKE